MLPCSGRRLRPRWRLKKEPPGRQSLLETAIDFLSFSPVPKLAHILAMESQIDPQTGSLAPLVAKPGVMFDHAWEKAHDIARRTSFAIHICSLMSYDRLEAGAHEGSGNLVSKKLGLVLTNGHIAGGGPSWGYATRDEIYQVRPMPTQLMSSACQP